MHAGNPPNDRIATVATSEDGNIWSYRNWLFVKIYTDEGITGVGECSGWPKVVQTAVNDLSRLLIGRDPSNIDNLWHMLFSSMMGHGMLGTVGAGALTGLDMALWDIKAKSLNVPLWYILGGKFRDKIKVYAHAGNSKRAKQLKEKGFEAIKTGGVTNILKIVSDIRNSVGDEVDIMVDVHGPPWLTTKDAIILGRKLEEFNILFFEDPVAPENFKGLAEVKDKVNIPIAAGERCSFIWGFKDLILNNCVDIIQPDTGRVGGITQLVKTSAIAESSFINVAPHSGSLGPVAEFAAIHVMAAIPNFLILEKIEDDVPIREKVITPNLKINNGYIDVPSTAGLGVDIIEEEIKKYPSFGNVSVPGDVLDGSYENNTWDEHVYFQNRYKRNNYFNCK